MIPLLAPVGINVVFTNMPSTLSEPFGGRCRLPVNLSAATEARLQILRMVAGAATSRLSVEWSTNLSQWTSLSSSTGPGVSLSATGWVDSGWTSLRAAARTSSFLRLSGQSGDGALDPAFASILLEVR